MTKNERRFPAVALMLLGAFLVWTTLVCTVDVQPIGPQGSSVGLATMNRWVHQQTGVCFPLYTVTDWLGLVPIAVCVGFAVMGLIQWISRKHLKNVDRDILVLGGFYLVTIAAYLLFESVTVNYRPVLIDGFLEGSYPSSTTLLVLCVMPTAMMQGLHRLHSPVWRTAVTAVNAAFIGFMVVGRLLSGVHWLSDILGGILLSGSLVCFYAAFCRFDTKQ